MIELQKISDCTIRGVTPGGITFSLSPEYVVALKKTFPKVAFHSPSMKKPKITPVNNNVVVRRTKKSATLEKQGALYLPVNNTIEITEEVEIVSISADIKPLSGGALVAKPGDRALIHNGVQGTPVTVGGEELFVVGYVNLICILA